MHYYVGFDIGGSTIKAALIDSEFKVHNYHEEPHSDISKDKLLSRIDDIIYSFKHEFRGIAVSIADREVNGKISQTSKIKSLRGFPLSNHLEVKYMVPVTLQNDADCFAVAEHRIGAGKGTDNMIGIIWGTGVGSGIISDKKLYLPESKVAGEIGKTIINPDGPVDCNGLRGSVESFCSPSGIKAIYRLNRGREHNPYPWDIFSSNEPAAKKTVQRVHDMLSIGISNVCNILSPKIIVMGGGLSHLPGLKKIENLAQKRVVDGVKVRIVRSKLDDLAGCVGAAILLEEYINQKLY